VKTKTNGKELKQFWNEGEPWWPKDGFVEGDCYVVNDEEKDDSWEPLSAADTDQITIIAGCICDGTGTDEGRDLQTVFRKWRKSLTTRILLVEVAAENLDEVIYGIKRGKGKIIS
jgi:hypothetical protein